MAAKAKQRALTAKGMLSHGNKISRGLLAGSELKCADNTGARVLRLIQAMGYKGRLRRYPSATVGDKVTVSVREAYGRHAQKDFPSRVIRQRKKFLTIYFIWLAFSLKTTLQSLLLLKAK